MSNSDGQPQQPDIVGGRRGHRTGFRLTNAMVSASSSNRREPPVNPPSSGSANPAFVPDINTEDISPGVTPGRNAGPTEPLPDLLDSHMLPPYVQARRNQHREAGRHRHRRRRRRQRHREGTTQIEDPDTSVGCCSRLCCLRCITTVTAFRWVLVALAMLGVCCVVTGIILGALHMTVGDSFLTLSLMFIGLGVMLVVVVGLGWKCTPQGHEPCHLLFNLGNHSPGAGSPRRTLRSHHRPRHGWHGGVLYPEFRHRRPPPSYNSSQTDFERDQRAAAEEDEPQENADNYSLPSSPPPTYRSRASTVRTGVEITFPPQPDSRPPTYRSHVSVTSRPAIPLDEVPPTAEEHIAIEIETPPSSTEENRRPTVPKTLQPESAEENAEISAMQRVKNAVRMFDNMTDSQPSNSSGSGERSAKKSDQKP